MFLQLRLAAYAARSKRSVEARLDALGPRVLQLLDCTGEVRLLDRHVDASSTLTAA
jgi:hypothetical protein